MNTFIPEIPNPIESARVVGSDILNDDYRRQAVPRGHREYVMGRSDLCELIQCPHRWVRGFEDDATKATEWGTLIDTILLQSDQADKLMAVCPETYPDGKTGEAKPWTFAANYCKDWKRANEGKLIVKGDTSREAQVAVEIIRNNPAAGPMIANSAKQVMVAGTYIDRDTGISVPLKGLIDIVPNKDHPTFGKSLADLKTAADASPKAWRRAITSRGYHAQAALYLDLYTKATGEDRCDFRHVVQENFAPYEVANYIVSQEFVSMGRELYTRALRLYCECLRDWNWPGYATGGLVLDGWSVVEPEPWQVSAS